MRVCDVPLCRDSIVASYFMQANERATAAISRLHNSMDRVVLWINALI